MAANYLEGNIPGRGFARVDMRGSTISRIAISGAEQPGKPALTPGLIDLQLNGFAGVDFSDPELTPDQVISILPRIWQTGATTFCPTLVTNTRTALARNFAVLEQARSDVRFARSAPCYHLEGPWISPGPSRGVHNPAWMRAPDWDEFEELQSAAGDNIGIVTLAPELPGALDFIGRLCDAGLVVAIGHTDCTPEQIQAAVDAGARMSTHLGNGCPQMIDRHTNPIWAQLTRDELSAGVICDGFHLPSDVVKVIARMKSRVVLVTDASHVAGLPPGRYRMAGTDIDLLPSGKVIKSDGFCLAGSALAMARAVTMFARLSGSSPEQAFDAATRNPAALLAGRFVCGEIASGAPANLILSRWGADALAVEAVYLGGEEVYRANG